MHWQPTSTDLQAAKNICSMESSYTPLDSIRLASTYKKLERNFMPQRPSCLIKIYSDSKVTISEPSSRKRRTVVATWAFVSVMLIIFRSNHSEWCQSELLSLSKTLTWAETTSSSVAQFDMLPRARRTWSRRRYWRHLEGAGVWRRCYSKFSPDRHHLTK